MFTILLPRRSLVSRWLLARHLFHWEPLQILPFWLKAVYPPFRNPPLVSIRWNASPLILLIGCISTGGNVGVSPVTITSVTGFSLVQDASQQFWTSTQVDGRLMGSTDAMPTPGLLTIAIGDMQTAYTDAMSESLRYCLSEFNIFIRWPYFLTVRSLIL